MTVKNMLAMLAAAALVLSASAISCPSLSASEVPAACASKDASTVCGPGCVDALFENLQSKVGPDVPCTESIAQCVSGITGPFLAAKGNLQALLGCNRNDIAARLQPKVQCKGTKPTLEQVKAQVSG